MDPETLISEASYKAVRSGGAGGQHVNKVATKVVLTFEPGQSAALSEAEKERIAKKLGRRLSKEGILTLSSDASRSQHKNKELVTRRFVKLIENALKVPKKRKKTTPSKAAIEKRLEAKKKLSEKKAGRKKPPHS